MIHGIGTCALMENGFDIVVRQKMTAHLADPAAPVTIMVIMNFLYFDFSDGLEEIMPSENKNFSVWIIFQFLFSDGI